jgi:hypothetical protein
MGGVSLFFDYILWHYSRALINGATIWANLMWFVVHFFSIPLLLRTLFSPWKRMHEEYSRGGFEDFMGMLVVNIMTRVVGFLTRIFVLLIGFVLLISFAIGFLVWSITWLLLPLLTVFSMLVGISFFVS